MTTKTEGKKYNIFESNLFPLFRLLSPYVYTNAVKIEGLRILRKKICPISLKDSIEQKQWI